MNVTDGQSPHHLITFAILAYNQEEYVAEAVRAALAQTYTPLEIILSDDCSADRTFDVMKEMVEAYSGPHEVVLSRNDENVGLARHVNRVAGLAAADFVILAAGDDISDGDRAAAIAAEIRKCPDVKAVVSGYSIIDRQGALIGKVVLPLDFAAFTHADTIAKKGGWIEMGAAFAYHRDCFRLPRPIPPEIQSEDRILPFRAALLGKIAYVRRPLLRYRKHGTSATAFGHFRSAAYEERHRQVMLEDLELLRKDKAVPHALYARTAAALDRYIRHYRRLDRLGPGLLARVYEALYNHELTTRRIALRISTFVRGRSRSRPLFKAR